MGFMDYDCAGYWILNSFLKVSQDSSFHLIQNVIHFFFFPGSNPWNLALQSAVNCQHMENLNLSQVLSSHEIDSTSVDNIFWFFLLVSRNIWSDSGQPRLPTWNNAKHVSQNYYLVDL